MDLAAGLGDDLAALLRGVDGRLRAVTPLSRRGQPAQVTAVRLDFADAPPLKGVQLRDAAHASRVAALAAALPDGLPRVVARAGAALLCEWVEGESLAATTSSADELRACGAWQARVHLFRPTAPAEAADLLRRWRRNVGTDLETLRAARLLADADAAALAARAAQAAPAHADAGVVLGDLCAENLVRRPSGAFCLIDIETLGIAPCDFDLARTWYRWSLTDAQRDAWLAGYRRHRDAGPFLAHRPFWSISALAKGAIFRWRERPADLAEPLAGLRALAAAD